MWLGEHVYGGFVESYGRVQVETSVSTLMPHRAPRCALLHLTLIIDLTFKVIRYAYGTDFWSIKAQIGTRHQIQAEPKASACIGDKYRTTTHMFNW